MSDLRDKIIANLAGLGLNQDEADVYLCLLEDSPKSVLNISQATGLGRNIIYRIVDQLAELGLVDKIDSSSGLKITALASERLNKIVKAKETELQSLKNKTEQVLGDLTTYLSQGNENQIKYYYGAAGLSEICINTTRAKDYLFVYELTNKQIKGRYIPSLNYYLTQQKAELLRAELVKNKIKVQQLTNVAEIPEWTNNSEYVRHHWQSRYLSPEKLTIDFEFLIYNDIFVLYTFQDPANPWGLEICSRPLALMQKQIFKNMWNQAEKMKLLNNQGKSSCG